jgi:hypothetical protein
MIGEVKGQKKDKEAMRVFTVIWDVCCFLFKLSLKIL